MGPPFLLFKVHCAVELRCKLGGEGSWECLERSEVRTCDHIYLPGRLSGQG